MVTASQLLCGNLIHIWQARSCKLELVAFGHPGDHPERSGPLCIPANSSGAILCLPHHRCKKWLRFFVPMLLQLYCAQKVEAEKHEPVASKTLGLHWSFAVHLHWVRICCQVWTPSASHCYPSGHTAFPYNFPHPFPRACENKKAHVWQLLHTEALGVIMESSDGNHLPHGSVPLAWPSVPPPSVTDSASWAENNWQFLRAVFSQNQSFEDKGQREKAHSFHEEIHWQLFPPCVTSRTPEQLQQHWTWTHPSRGKQGFLQILFYLLQSAVPSVSIQSAISLTIKPDVRRHGSSTGTESMPFGNAE